LDIPKYHYLKASFPALATGYASFHCFDQYLTGLLEHLFLELAQIVHGPPDIDKELRPFDVRLGNFDFSAAATSEAVAKSWTTYLSEAWLPMSAR